MDLDKLFKRDKSVSTKDYLIVNFKGLYAVFKHNNNITLTLIGTFTF